MRGRRFQMLCLAGSLLLMATPASAQRERVWELEVFGGSRAGVAPIAGEGVLPSPGTPFVTQTGLPSRRVSTWYFGDGALLLNQVIQGMGRAARITSLDAALTRPALHRERAGTGGLRLRRRIQGPYAIEVSVEYGAARLTLTPDALAAAEASHGTFIAAWGALFPVSGFTMTSIYSEMSAAAGGRQVTTTGALAVNLLERGSVAIYATGGGGVASRLGGTPAVTLTGEYRTSLGLSPFAEHDNVRWQFDVPRHAFVAVAGSGVTYAFSPAWGVRGDIRWHVARERQTSLVDASPAIETVTTNTLVFAYPSSPTIQLRNAPQPGQGIGPAQPTFGGPAIAGFETFEGSATVVRVALTAGVFLRF